MAVETRPMTVTEFEKFIAEHPERRFELINGEIFEKITTEEHGAIVAIITAKIFHYVQRSGRVATKPRHRHADDEYHDLIPDVAFTGKERALPIVTKGVVPQLPDLAVEIKSPDDTYNKMREKAAIYLQHGCRMVWLVYPEKKLVEVYQPDKDLVILTIEDTIEGGDVLPNFQLPVRDIFDL